MERLIETEKPLLLLIILITQDSTAKTIKFSNNTNLNLPQVLLNSINLKIGELGFIST